MRIKGQEQGGAFLHEAHPGVLVPVHAALVAFGVSAPPFEVEIVLRQITRLASHKQTWRNTRHHATPVLLHGIRARLQLLLHTRTLRVPLGTRAPSRLERRLENAALLSLRAQRRVEVRDGRQPAGNRARSPREMLVSRPPFWASGLRWRDAWTSPKASAIRRPGG
jgi:hypothetical protein